MSNRQRRAIVLTAVAVSLSSAASAQDPRWDVVLGAAAQYAPEYEGGDEMDVTPVPFLQLSYGRLSLDPGGLRISILETPGMQVGASLGYGGGRESSDLETDHLDGMPDIDSSAILGLDAAYDFGMGEGYVEVERYLGGTEGISVTFGARTGIDLSPRLRLFADLSMTASDDSYMQGYFGVSAADALASGLAEYDAGAGLRRADLSVGATYGLSERMFLRGEINIGRLMGDAEDSPVVVESLQPSVSLFLGYRF